MLKKDLLIVFLPLLIGGGFGFLISSSQDTGNEVLELKNELESLQEDVAHMKKKLSFSEAQNTKLRDELRKAKLQMEAAQASLKSSAQSTAAIAKAVNNPESERVDVRIIQAPVQEEESEEKEELKESLSLVSSLKRMEKANPERINRQVERIMEQKLKDLELEEEAEKEVENLLLSYFKEQNELNYMMLDSSVPPDLILQKIQELHTKTLTDLNQHVQYDVAEGLISSNKGEQHERVVSQFLGKYKRFELDESLGNEIKIKVQEYVEGHPYLEFTGRNRSTPNFPADITYDEIMQRREYVGDTTTLSELMAKSVDTKYEAQLQLYDELNLSLEEKDQAAFMEMLESEKNRSSRSINFFKNLEENPDMAEAWLKLSSGMRRGEGGGGRRDN
jgi:hypothetical protein